MKVNGRELPLVYIEWEDSFGVSTSWEDIDGMKATLTICASVGWLVHDDKKCKVVVPHLTSINRSDVDSQGCGDMTIPASAVVKMVRLKIK